MKADQVLKLLQLVPGKVVPAHGSSIYGFAN